MMNNNTKCPRYRDHLENAIDRTFPDGIIKSCELSLHWENIQEEATTEYQNCEGH